MDDKSTENREGMDGEDTAGEDTIQQAGQPEEYPQEGVSQGRRPLWKYIVILLVLLAVVVPGGIYVYKYMEESDPNYYIQHQKMGENYFRQGLYDQAIQEFQKSVKVKPDFFVPNYGLALSYLRAKNYEKAVESLEKTLKIAPDRVDVRYSLGVAYQRMGRLEKALQEYHEVGKMDPHSHQVFNNAGTIYAEMKMFDKAIQAFEASIRRNPDYYPAYFNLARIYESQGKKDLASRQYKIVRDRASKKPQAENFAKMAEQRLAALNTPREGGGK